VGSLPQSNHLCQILSFITPIIFWGRPQALLWYQRYKCMDTGKNIWIIDTVSVWSSTTRLSRCRTQQRSVTVAVATCIQSKLVHNYESIVISLPSSFSSLFELFSLFWYCVSSCSSLTEQQKSQLQQIYFWCIG